MSLVPNGAMTRSEIEERMRWLETEIYRHREEARAACRDEFEWDDYLLWEEPLEHCWLSEEYYLLRDRLIELNRGEKADRRKTRKTRDLERKDALHRKLAGIGQY